VSTGPAPLTTIDPVTYYNWKRKFGFTKSPKKTGRPNRFSEEEKLAILEAGNKNGIPRTCAAYEISLATYYHWKGRLGYCRSPRRSFTDEARRLIVNDAINDGIAKACDKHRLWAGTIHAWARQLGKKIPDQRSRFSTQEKRAIVEDGIRNGISKTSRAYKIDPKTVRRWRQKLGL
jgi:transposase-like protein